MNGLERYREMLDEYGLVPFQRYPYVNERTERVEPRVLGHSLPLRWRVSADEWDRLLAMVDDLGGAWTYPSRSMETRIMGWPVDKDETLPPRSIVLEVSRGAADAMNERLG